MGLFGALVRTVVNVTLLPVAAVKDAMDVACGEDPRNLRDQVEKLKEEADEDE